MEDQQQPRELPAPGPVPTPQIDAFLTRVVPEIVFAARMVEVLRSQRRDPALIEPIEAQVYLLLSTSRHIFTLAGANHATMTQIDALIAKLERRCGEALDIVRPAA